MKCLRYQTATWNCPRLVRAPALVHCLVRSLTTAVEQESGFKIGRQSWFTRLKLKLFFNCLKILKFYNGETVTTTWATYEYLIFLRKELKFPEIQETEAVKVTYESPGPLGARTAATSSTFSFFELHLLPSLSSEFIIYYYSPEPLQLLKSSVYHQQHIKESASYCLVLLNSLEMRKYICPNKS